MAKINSEKSVRSDVLIVLTCSRINFISRVFRYNLTAPIGRMHLKRNYAVVNLVFCVLMTEIHCKLSKYFYFNLIVCVATLFNFKFETRGPTDTKFSPNFPIKWKFSTCISLFCSTARNVIMNNNLHSPRPLLFQSRS